MNVNGILGSLNFPSFAGFSGGVFVKKAKTDPADALLAVKAYNDWHLLEWCATAPDRLLPLILLPLWDMGETVAELTRMAKLGVHAISFPDNPTATGLPSLHNEYWEPLWKTCADHEVMINCHIGTGHQPPHASKESPIDAWITTMPISISHAAADWLWAPFWKRYPNLRMALSEGGIGWIPYLLERADHTYVHHHEWTFSEFDGGRPSDIFNKHIVTCFIDDKFGLKNLADMNPDMICYECDYPHSDTLWPEAPEYLWNSMKHLEPAIIDKITHQNAMRLYSYQPFEAMGGRDKCTVGALRQLGRDVDVSTKAGLGGLKPQAEGEPRRPVTSGDIQKMLA
jgi:predicted TIM-barrel fold metal-dependent hydrolase